MLRVLALFAACLSFLLAQEFRATLSGSVKDVSGAVVPGARVVATNVETGVASTTTAGDNGGYLLAALPPGRYKLEVEHPGFKRYVREGLTLQVADRPVVDISLEPGDLATSVNVTAEAPVLETSTASRGSVITGRTVVDLPLNGRNAFALAGLEPGVNFTARTQASTFFRTTANGGISSMNIGGGLSKSNEALLDGVPNTGTDGTIQFVPSVDATQEFRVQTNAFDAEYGRFTGGIINAVIRSGTNDFHGNAFEFFRNSVLNARDPFASSIPQFGYNLFGGSLGGPIWVPKLYQGRNRTFFFFNYEGSREGVPRAFVSTVPTLAQRSGDFSQTLVRSGAQVLPLRIYDPATTRQSGTTYVRDQFPNNIIPTSRINPIAQQLINLYPLPNAPGDAVTGASNYLLSFKDTVRDDGYVAKVDHRFSDRHAIFGRFSTRKFTVTRQGAFKNPVTGDRETRNAPGVALDDTFTLNPTTVLNVRYGFTRYVVNSAADDTGLDITSLGFPASYAAQLPVVAIPQITVTNGYATLSGANKLNRTAEDSHTLRGGITKVLGSHTVRAGAEYRLLHSATGSLGSAAAGTFSFDTVFTRGPNPQVAANDAGFGLASLLLGLPASGSVTNNAATFDSAPYYGFYLQDDFRVSRRLTVNAGLRYEWEGAYTERYNRLNRGFALNQSNPIEAAARAAYAASPLADLPSAQFNVRGGLLFAGVNGQPSGLSNIDRNNLAPRVGAAYQLLPKTLLRAGYGIFYGASTLSDEARLGFSVSTPFVGTVNAGLTPLNTLSNPFPAGLQAPAGSSQGLSSLLGQGITFTSPDRRQPYLHQYQVSIQQELPSSILLEIAYVGSLGRDLPVNQPLNGIPEQFRAAAEATFFSTGRNTLNDTVANPFVNLITTGTLSSATTTRGQLLRPYPEFTSVTASGVPIGSSNYNALQVKANKRFSNGFSFTAAFAQTKTLERLRFLNDQDLRPVKELNGFDIPQRFVLSTTYELPFGPGRRFLNTKNGLVARLVEGFQLNAIYTAQSGIPLEIVGAESLGRSARLDDPTVGQWFDTSAFRTRQAVELTRTSRLPDVRSAGKNNVDLSLFKTVHLTETVRLQFRAEAFNAANRAEYDVPGTTFGSATFGRVTASNTIARQIQFALKLLF